MKQSPLSTVCRAICRAALAVIASACVMTANAQTISTVLLPADREVYSKQSTSATLFNGEPFIAYKRCATSGCGVVQEIAITYCVSNCGTANPVWRDRVISNAPSSVFGEYVAAAIARDGNPMITWVDVSFAGASPSTVMVARCIAECDSERPRYVSHPVATLASGSLDRIALIDAGASGSGQTVAFIQTAEGQHRLRVEAVEVANERRVFEVRIQRVSCEPLRELLPASRRAVLRGVVCGEEGAAIGGGWVGRLRGYGERNEAQQQQRAGRTQDGDHGGTAGERRQEPHSTGCGHFVRGESRAMSALAIAMYLAVGAAAGLLAGNVVTRAVNARRR